jgi:hypothetical protein
VSRDGRLAVVEKGALSGDAYDIVRVTRGGTVVPLDTSWTGQFQGIAVSRDGAKVAVGVLTVASEEVHVLDLRSRSQVRVAAKGVFFRDPAFAPGGGALVAAGFGSTVNGIYRVPLAAAASPERLWSSPVGVWMFRPRFSSDGSTIYYHDAENDRSVLRARRIAAPEEPGEVIADGVGEVSPDDRWVAYRSAEPGADGIFVRPRAAGASERWQVASGTTGAPRWSPDGREILFHGGDSIYAVAVRGGATFTVGARRGVVARAGYADAFDIFPNGDLAMLRERYATGATSLLMIENWRAALRQ